MLQNFTLLDPPSFAHCWQLKLPTLHKDVHKLNRHYNEHVYSEHDTVNPRSSGLDCMALYMYIHIHREGERERETERERERERESDIYIYIYMYIYIWNLQEIYRDYMRNKYCPP